jgi:hypoxanthine phosphoribosyltransferase
MAESQKLHPDVERVLIAEGDVRRRVRELAREISRDYAGRSPMLVGVLKGCVLFLSELMQELELDCCVDFICLASYSGTSSSGVVRMLLDLRDSAQGRDVLVVEDIVDTGLTIGYLMQNLQTRGPRSVEVCTLLDKPECRKIGIQPKYVGFSIPNEFVVGFGLDYQERYRNLPYVGVLKPSVVRKGD